MSQDMSNLTEKSLPADDPNRQLIHVQPKKDGQLRHIAVAGDVYTILVTGEDTAGRYCLIDMRVPLGGGPPLHRHDFEEMFSVFEGEIEVTFRGEKTTVRAGETINIPANAPHHFTNVSGKPARMFCMCTPAGQDEFFLKVGDPVENGDSLPPELSEDEKAERMKKAKELAPKYKTEMLA